MTSFEIRKIFLDFFKGQEHKHLSSSPLIPKKDLSLLFVNAGMNQFKPVILGLEKPAAKNVVTIQKCLRAGGKHNDLENVGRTPYHHTFFEMMGNFSFGGYFKQRAIALAWEFLTEKLKLSPENLWISVYEKDEESYEIWRKEQNIPENRIYRMGEKENFWQMGDIGPCGPCTEIHYYKGPETRPDPNQFVEVWNLVFMEFYDTEKGTREKLSVPCVDTGMGLERLCSILQNEKSNYHIDLFKGVIKSLEEASGFSYDFTETSQSEQQVAFRVLADHSRAAAFLIGDRVEPGNEGQRYVLRRILRRAFFYSDRLNSKKNLLSVASQTVIDLMGEVYPVLREEKALIDSTIKEEAELFKESLKAGKNILLKKIQDLPDKTVPDTLVWNLYSTYGFPPDLTRLIVREKGFKVNETFNLEELKEKQAVSFRQIVVKDLLKEFKRQYRPDKTDFTYYEKDKENSKIAHLIFLKIEDETMDENGHSSISRTPLPLSWVKKESSTSMLIKYEKITQNGLSVSQEPEKINLSEENEQALWLITDKTCFYPEGGGPRGDKGTLKTDTGEARILDCLEIGGSIFHKIEVEGELKKDQPCTMEVDADHRPLIKSSHSATHLLNQALREELGSSVRQAGSLVLPGKLRFDFFHREPLTETQIEEIEKRVNKNIQSKNPVSASLHSYEEAVQTGALFLKGENYSSQVRVITMGRSREFCGGIHVKNTSDIGCFKIISETGVQSGVRRITAYTSKVAEKWLAELAIQNLKLRNYLKISFPEQKDTKDEGNPFISWIKERDEEIKQLRNQLKNLTPPGREKTKSDKSSKAFRPQFWLGDFLRKNWSLILKMCSSAFMKKRNTDQSILKGGGLSIDYEEWIKKNMTHRDGLARQILELKKYLKLPALKDMGSPSVRDGKQKEDQSPFILSMENKKKEIQSLKNQLANLPWDSLSKEKLKEQASPFQFGNVRGLLLVMDLPVRDKKLLADMTDQLKLKISSGVVVVLGEGKDSWPVVVTVTRDLQKYISAGELMKKTIIPVLGGKGGGQARFAQGMIINKNHFQKLESILLQAFEKL